MELSSTLPAACQKTLRALLAKNVGTGQGCHFQLNGSSCDAVRELHAAALHRDNLSIIQAGAKQLDTSKKLLHVADGTCLPYDKICICTGASPKVDVVVLHQSLDAEAPPACPAFSM